jgi:hypothetical protein
VAKTVTANQQHALLYIARYETPEFGVIIRFATAEALVTRGYATSAPRRRFARETGLCVRLTAKGRAWVDA